MKMDLGIKIYGLMGGLIIQKKVNVFVGIIIHFMRTVIGLEAYVYVIEMMYQHIFGFLLYLMTVFMVDL